MRTMLHNSCNWISKQREVGTREYQEVVSRNYFEPRPLERGSVSVCSPVDTIIDHALPLHEARLKTMLPGALQLHPACHTNRLDCKDSQHRGRVSHKS